jgi:hypothetical protein
VTVCGYDLGSQEHGHNSVCGILHSVTVAAATFSGEDHVKYVTGVYCAGVVYQEGIAPPIAAPHSLGSRMCIGKEV